MAVAAHVCNACTELFVPPYSLCQHVRYEQMHCHGDTTSLSQAHSLAICGLQRCWARCLSCLRIPAIWDVASAGLRVTHVCPHARGQSESMSRHFPVCKMCTAFKFLKSNFQKFLVWLFLWPTMHNGGVPSLCPTINYSTDVLVSTVPVHLAFVHADVIALHPFRICRGVHIVLTEDRRRVLEEAVCM